MKKKPKEEEKPEIVITITINNGNTNIGIKAKDDINFHKVIGVIEHAKHLMMMEDFKHVASLEKQVLPDK